MDPTALEPAADFRADQLQSSLADSGFSSVTVLDRVDSTNRWLAELTREGGGAELRAVVTGFQSAGKGRLDRQWFTPPGVALTFSVACSPHTPAGEPWPVEYVPWLTLIMAHSVTHVVRNLVGVPAVIKWPNDVLVDSRKVCGVLASLVSPPDGSAPSAVVGAGLNVSQRHLPVPAATSLLLEAGDAAAVPGRQALLTEILREFARCYHRVSVDPGAELGPGGDVRALLESEVDTLGRRVALHLPGSTVPEQAVAEGLGTSGELLVRGHDGAARALSAGDVVHVRPTPGEPRTAAEQRAIHAIRDVTAGDRA
ncbi:biotin--[acetyl-CoA-carboxylase] ligase [Kocuria sp. cx-455]|uniref:biotin--[acetyl-CoA-carboxylase] ligase n=1 Tax=unclassified Candidatus Sulfotelmatobacter TaxID=2635724 RepID=UPI001683F5EF|nr:MULTISPECIES: biotin--[acetyl-CoA-carboxylase] ligase [unclassified Candidatus Sulfotelmatobacter]MBD2762691.1 biotin--[acetyl-CoA-carboxylase] ligase [Kocuria sp. cx-116]MBD2765260.1 biotin--[acetyl-CoA-carboxylase] ligase [Kocuria sp. cx-455]